MAGRVHVIAYIRLPTTKASGDSPILSLYSASFGHILEESFTQGSKGLLTTLWSYASWCFKIEYLSKIGELYGFLFSIPSLQIGIPRITSASNHPQPLPSRATRSVLRDSQYVSRACIAGHLHKLQEQPYVPNQRKRCTLRIITNQPTRMGRKMGGCQKIWSKSNRKLGLV